MSSTKDENYYLLSQERCQHRVESKDQRERNTYYMLTSSEECHCSRAEEDHLKQQAIDAVQMPLRFGRSEQPPNHHSHYWSAYAKPNAGDRSLPSLETPISQCSQDTNLQEKSQSQVRVFD